MRPTGHHVLNVLAAFVRASNQDSVGREAFLHEVSRATASSVPAKSGSGSRETCSFRSRARSADAEPYPRVSERCGARTARRGEGIDGKPTGQSVLWLENEAWFLLPLSSVSSTIRTYVVTYTLGPGGALSDQGGTRTLAGVCRAGGGRPQRNDAERFTCSCSARARTSPGPQEPDAGNTSPWRPLASPWWVRAHAR
jgi:hypothetical protein